MRTCSPRLLERGGAAGAGFWEDFMSKQQPHRLLQLETRGAAPLLPPVRLKGLLLASALLGQKVSAFHPRQNVLFGSY
jgi:hypothetical protein